MTLQLIEFNAEFDYVFLRGSNYIHSTMTWWRALEVLPRLRIPIIAFGIGAQAPKEGPMVLSEETERVLRLIADSSVSVGVRGAYTAEVLWNLGIRNTRIIGCPTAFRRNDPDLRIALPPLELGEEGGVHRAAGGLRRLCRKHRTLSHPPSRHDKGNGRPLRSRDHDAGRGRGEETSLGNAAAEAGGVGKA